MPPPCPPCSLPRRCRSLHQPRSDDGSSGCGPHESHIWIKTGIHVSNVVMYTYALYPQRLNATCVSWRHGRKRAVDQTKRGKGCGRKVVCDERGPVDESYLPLGRSPSSFLQRTVGTGSPRASHLNSTLWSTNTTWLPGRRTKLGRSVQMKTAPTFKVRAQNDSTGIMFPLSESHYICCFDSLN